MDKDIYYCIQSVVAYYGGLHIAHWQANTLTNEHKTLGDLYEKIIELIDEFTEVYMGKYGMIKFKKGIELPDLKKEPIKPGIKLVKDLQEYFKAGEDDDLLNILADMLIELNRAEFLLKK